MTIYHILSAIGGAILGLVVMALCAVASGENSYQEGYRDGHFDGFDDGVKSVDEVG